MKGDFTRLSADPFTRSGFGLSNQYRGVLMQQGRVLLDSDWNEQVQIAEHRYSTFFSDFVGESGAPANNGIAAKEVSQGVVVLTKGRYYVDGLLVENRQDYFPLPELQEGDGLYLVYLDAWTNHITAAEDNTLIEPALGGAETTTRIYTEWRLRAKKVDELNASVTEKRKRYRPSWPKPGDANDWELPLSSGQLWVHPNSVHVADNRLYRIEIHNSGAPGTATFKWSRDNGSTVTRVKQIDGNKTLVLENPDKRTVDAFDGAQYVEVIDAQSFRRGDPGEMRALAQAGVQNGCLIVKDALPALSAGVITVRRWDSLPSEIKLGDPVTLGSDLDVSFRDVGGKAYYRTGDYWLIPIRFGRVLDWFSDYPQPANGIYHHFAALALLRKQQDGITMVDASHTPFQPLTSGAVSKLGDEIKGDLCVRGRLGIGLCNYRAPLSITAAADGTLLSFEDQSGSEAWRISQGTDGTPSLSIADSDRNGLTILKGGMLSVPGKARIGTGDYNAPLSITAAPDGALLSFGDQFGEKWRITATSGDSPSLSITGNVHNMPAEGISFMPGGILRIARGDDYISIDPWVGSNGCAIGFRSDGTDKANLYWIKRYNALAITATAGTNTVINPNEGYVGIGTWNPAAKLHIGTGEADTPLMKVSLFAFFKPDPNASDSVLEQYNKKVQKIQSVLNSETGPALCVGGVSDDGKLWLFGKGRDQVIYGFEITGSRLAEIGRL
jgi:hypothetical protein